MRNRPIFKKIQDGQDIKAMSLEQLKALGVESVKAAVSLTDQEVRELRQYFPGIKELLIRDFERQVRESEKNSVVDKLLNLGFAQEESQLAAEQIIKYREDSK